MSKQILELEGTWEEICAHDAILSGHKVRLTVFSAESEISSEQNPPNKYRLSVREMLKLPLKERDIILAAQATNAEVFYRTDPDLTCFDACGEEDYFDETS